MGAPCSWWRRTSSTRLRDTAGCIVAACAALVQVLRADVLIDASIIDRCSSASSSTWRRWTASATSAAPPPRATPRSRRCRPASAVLERELGVPLVRRGREFEALTPEGELILGWAQRALADLESLQQEASRGCAAGWRARCGSARSRPRCRCSPLRHRALPRAPPAHARAADLDELAPDRARPRARRDRGRAHLPRQRAARATSTRVPLWREHYLLVTPAGADVRRDSVTWAEAATLPLCLLTPDMQHRRIVDGAFAAAGATPAPAVETNSVSTLVAHARAGPAGHHRPHLARRQPAARRPARDPARRARRSSTRSGSSPPARSSARR